MSKYYYLKELNNKNLKEMLNCDINNNFHIENILNKDVLMDIGLKYCIIYNYDSIITDKIENVDIHKDNIMEARFFDENCEIRIFREEDLFGTIFKENENSKSIKRESLVSPRYQKKNNYVNKIIYNQYLDYDEDNQAYIRYTKPIKLCFKEGNNEAN